MTKLNSSTEITDEVIWFYFEAEDKKGWEAPVKEALTKDWGEKNVISFWEDLGMVVCIGDGWREKIFKASDYTADQ